MPLEPLLETARVESGKGQVRPVPCVSSRRAAVATAVGGVERSQFAAPFNWITGAVEVAPVPRRSGPALRGGQAVCLGSSNLEAACHSPRSCQPVASLLRPGSLGERTHG